MTEPWHGTPGGYNNHSCRETCCKTAHAADMKRKRARRAAELLENPELAPHGEVSTYNNWGCRCPQCTVAKQGSRAAAHT